jgi:CelD/BcsL family acetyltransferase involved in cellulose biosynthesis
VAIPAPRPTAGRETRAATRLALGLARDRAALEALEPEWTALFARHGLPHQVFQDFAWLSIWSQHYHDADARLAIVTGRIDGALALVWPLVIRGRPGFRVLSFMGEPVSQYGDALLDPALSDDDLDAAFDFMRALPVEVLAFNKVRDDAAIAPLLRRRLGAPANPQQAPYIDFTGAACPKSFEMRYSGKLRSSRRRHLRRLEELGPVRFAHYGPSPEASALVPIALGFKREWARRGGALGRAIEDPRFEQFFIAAAGGAGPCPSLRVSAVTCGETIAGVEISVACKGHLFGHVLAPNPAFEKPGIGGILAGRSIVSALEQGFEVYDTLAPADAYKRDWTTTAIGLGDYVAGRGPLGALYVGLWLRRRARLKTALKRLPAPARRAAIAGLAWARAAFRG